METLESPHPATPFFADTNKKSDLTKIIISRLKLFYLARPQEKMKIIIILSAIFLALSLATPVPTPEAESYPPEYYLAQTFEDADADIQPEMGSFRCIISPCSPHSSSCRFNRNAPWCRRPFGFGKK